MSSYSDWEETIVDAVLVRGATAAHFCELLREMWDDAQEQGRREGKRKETAA